MTITDLLCLAVGLAVGFGTGWFSYRGRQIVKRDLAESEALALKKNLGVLEVELARVAERNRLAEEAHQTLQNELAQERQFNISLHAELSRERASRSHLEQRLEHQKTELLQLQQRMAQEFRNLVQQVLEEKSQSLTDLNKSGLNMLLQPISEKLQDFKQKIEEQHYRETRELIVLHNKLSNLEASRWNHQNGQNGSLNNANGFVNGHQLGDLPDIENDPGNHDPNTYVNYPSVLPDEPPATEGTPNSEVLSTQPATETSPDGEAFQAFTPKQQVEIDNFFKRTLGRTQRKKPANGN